MRYMLFQLICVLSWLVCLGYLGFIIQNEDGDMMAILQGWGDTEPMFFDFTMGEE